MDRAVLARESRVRGRVLQALLARDPPLLLPTPQQRQELPAHR